MLKVKARFIYAGLVIAWAILAACFGNQFFSFIGGRGLDSPPVGPFHEVFLVFLGFEMMALTPALIVILLICRFDILGPSAFRVYVTMPTVALFAGVFGFINPLILSLIGYLTLAPPLTFIGNFFIVYFIRRKFLPLLKQQKANIKTTDYYGNPI